MRKLLRFFLLKPILWVTRVFSSSPNRERIFTSLTALLAKIKTSGGKKGYSIPFEIETESFIIFSDQHKGRKNGADDFVAAESNYLTALDHYFTNNFHLIALGDCEELWENTWLQVRKHNTSSFNAEKKFAIEKRFTKIFGNHDLDWEIDPLAPVYLKEIYGVDVIALEAVLLQTTCEGKPLDIFCTHGHQGDLQSDGDWFSKFFVAKIWAPLQAYIKINPNTPAYHEELKNLHNMFMYEWSAQQKDLILITGHTHQPVFESLTHVERLQRVQKKALYEHNSEWAEALDLEIQWRKHHEFVRQDYMNLKPNYFNSGCCCYADGDITGIEITKGFIRLIKWKMNERIVLEEKRLADLLKDL